MDLELYRSYFPSGTNGVVYCRGKVICHTIELPWRANQKRISCIPEGSYHLKARYTEKRGWHLQVVKVPGRTWILFHPANDALRELLGCIAPVTKLLGPGYGTQSRLANERLLNHVLPAIRRDEEVLLHITRNSKMVGYEYSEKS